MSRRIEIELTSARSDGTWTWRAAGALKPRGVLDGAVLYAGAKAGDVVRADAEFEIDGITILAVLPPKEKKRPEKERIELIGSRPEGPGVTASLVPARRGRPDGPTPGRRREDAAPRRTGRPGDDRSAGTVPGPAGAERRRRSERPAERESGRGRAGQRGRPAPAEARTGSTGSPAETPAAPSRPKAKRLSPGNRHRSEVLEALPAEQRPIAEQVLRGGIPAVRTAIHLEREKATGEGRVAPNADALLAIAEELLPRLKAAEWHDRAEAAAKVADEVALRDLRSVVAGSDVARDEESRQLAATLRDALERRAEAQRQEWLNEVGGNLSEGRLVRALRLSARPPDPGIKFPAEMANQLAEAAGQGLSPDTTADRWIAVLEAVAASPVRRLVKPAGLPPEPAEPLLRAARRHAGQIPSLAALLGIPIPPPPGPPAGASRRVRPKARRPPSGAPRPRTSRPSPSPDDPSDNPPPRPDDRPPASTTEPGPPGESVSPPEAPSLPPDAPPSEPEPAAPTGGY